MARAASQVECACVRHAGAPLFRLLHNHILLIHLLLVTLLITSISATSPASAHSTRLLSCPDSILGTDANWDRSFFTPGPSFPGDDPQVNVLIPFQGRLLALGRFIETGGVKAGGWGWASWDGARWSAMDIPFSFAYVADAVVWHDRLVLAGLFGWGSLDSSSVVAVWDGESWSTLGDLSSDLWSSTARAILADGDGLIIAGSIPAPAGSNSPGVARWDGAHWSGLGQGLAFSQGIFGPYEGAEDLVRYQGDVLACGTFSISAGDTATQIARWNGASWEPFGERPRGGGISIHMLSASGDTLFAAGRFDSMGAVPASCVAMWNGAWSGLGGIRWGSSLGDVHAVLPWQGGLLVLGFFDTVGPDSTRARNVAFRSGGDWRAMGDGFNALQVSYAHTAATYRDELYVGGYFTGSGDRLTGAAARWDGSAWQPIGPRGGALPTPTDAVASTPGGIVVSRTVRNSTRFSLWTGTEWRDAAAPLTGQVLDLAWYGDRLVAGGDFLVPGGTECNIAAWDGNAWESLAPGDSGAVSCLRTFRGDLYVGGEFEGIGGVGGTRGIARWDGRAWHDVGQGVQGYVHDLHPCGMGLLVSGIFWFAGNLPAESVALWSGASWELPWTVEHMDVPEVPSAVAWGKGIVTLGPTDEDGQSGLDLRYWDGSGWSLLPYPPGISEVERLETYGDLLVAAGTPCCDGDAIMCWDGTCWRTLGQGTGPGRSFSDPTVTDIEVTGQDLVFTGDLVRAGGASSANIAWWHGAGEIAAGIPSLEFAIAPNPSRDEPMLRFEIAEPGEVTVNVYDVLGRRIHRIGPTWEASGAHVEPLGRPEELGLSPGVYFVRLSTGSGAAVTRRWVVAR